MIQQKSEDCVVPEGPRKLASTRALPGGGKAVPVKGVGQQGLLPFATAESPRKRGTERKPKSGLPGGGAHKVPKAKVNQPIAAPAKMEEVVERLTEALYKDHHLRSPAAHAVLRSPRGRDPAGGGGDNPRPEEPYVNGTSTVLWELGAGNRPWLPDATSTDCARIRPSIQHPAEEQLACDGAGGFRPDF